MPPPDPEQVNASVTSVAAEDGDENSSSTGNVKEGLSLEDAKIRQLNVDLDYREKRFKQDIKEREQLLEQRERYADYLFKLIAIWLVGVFILLALSGGEIEVCGRIIGVKFSDTVLVTYLTTTTVTVLGLFVIVAKWLFSPLQKSSDEAAE
jgi:hypothetical protein